MAEQKEREQTEKEYGNGVDRIDQAPRAHGSSKRDIIGRRGPRFQHWPFWPFWQHRGCSWGFLQSWKGQMPEEKSMAVKLSILFKKAII